ncbi:MAG: FAD-dependent oxidoreductase, partial [Pseudomonadota bacterium]
ALACQARGLSVRLFEAKAIGAGASGGIVGALSPHVPDQWNAKKAYQFSALTAAQAYWHAIEARSGLPTGFARSGRLLPLFDDNGIEIAQSRTLSSRDLWEGKASWQVLPASEVPSWLSGPFKGVVHETLSARLMPHLAVKAMAQAFQAQGGTLDKGRSVDGVEDGEVSGPCGTARSSAIVLANGVEGLAWLGAQTGRRAGSPVKGQAMLLDAPQFKGRPLVYADGLYVIPHEGGQVAIGSTSENSFEDPTRTDAQLDALRARAEALCPELSGAQVLTRWAGLRPKAKRRDPMLGLAPGFERVFLANGAFKIGFGLAPKIGETLADMITGRAVELPESFTPAWHLG